MDEQNKRRQNNNEEIIENGYCTRDDLHEYSSPGKTAKLEYPFLSEVSNPYYIDLAYHHRRRHSRFLLSSVRKPTC